MCETVSTIELCLSLPYTASGYLGQFRLCNSARKSRGLGRRPKLMIPRTHRCIIDCDGAGSHRLSPFRVWYCGTASARTSLWSGTHRCPGFPWSFWLAIAWFPLMWYLLPDSRNDASASGRRLVPKLAINLKTLAVLYYLKHIHSHTSSQWVLFLSLRQLVSPVSLSATWSYLEGCYSNFSLVSFP